MPTSDDSWRVFDNSSRGRYDFLRREVWTDPAQFGRVSLTPVEAIACPKTPAIAGHRLRSLQPERAVLRTGSSSTVRHRDWSGPPPPRPYRVEERSVPSENWVVSVEKRFGTGAQRLLLRSQ